jgi:hypothetical protein
MSNNWLLSSRWGNGANWLRDAESLVGFNEIGLARRSSAWNVARHCTSARVGRPATSRSSESTNVWCDAVYLFARSNPRGPGYRDY